MIIILVFFLYFFFIFFIGIVRSIPFLSSYSSPALLSATALIPMIRTCPAIFNLQPSFILILILLFLFIAFLPVIIIFVELSVLVLTIDIDVLVCLLKSCKLLSEWLLCQCTGENFYDRIWGVCRRCFLFTFAKSSIFSLTVQKFFSPLEHAPGCYSIYSYLRVLS